MKQLKLLFTVLFLAVLGLGNVWATDPDVTFMFKTLQVTSGTSSTGSISFETGKTGSATATACNATNGLVLYGVSGGGGYFNTTSATSKAIESITVVSTAKKNTPKYTAYGSTNGTDWTEIEGDIAAGTKTFDVSDESYTYFKIHNTTGATAQLGVTSISFVLASGSENPTVNVDVDNSQSILVGATLNVADLFTVNTDGYDGTLSYAIKNDANKDNATLVGTTLTGVSAGTVTVVASAAATGSFAAVNKEATVTVTEPPFEGTEVAWVASAQGYTNGTQYATATADANISFAFGDGTNDGKYYDTGTGIRLYSNGKVTVTAANEAIIKKIVLTYSDASYAGTFSANVGSYSLSETTGTWTGSASSVVLTNTATSGHARIQKIVVSYTGGITTPILESIEVKTAPTTVTYTEGQKFDPAGLVITKIMSAGDPEDVEYAGNESAFTFVPSLTADLATTDTKVTITYGGKSVDQAITVTPFVPTAGTYEIVPNNVFFNCNAFTSKPSGFTGATGTKDGITVDYIAASSAYINDASSRAYNGTKVKISAPEGFELTAIEFTGSTWVAPTASVGTMNSKSWTGNASEVTFTFTGTSYMTNIAVTYATPVKSTIILAECENGSVGASATTDVKAGTVVTLSNTPDLGYNFVAYDVYKTGETTTKVTVTDGKFTMPAYDVTVSATFEVAKVFDGTELTLSGEYPTEFWKGDAFSHEGMTVTAHFNTGDENVISSAVFSGYDMTTAGTQTVTVTFTEGGVSQTATYEITVQSIGNTQETAYTPAQAKALYDAGNDLSTLVYVKGIVSEMVSTSLPTSGYLNFYVSEDGTTEGLQFEFYKTYKAAGTKWTSIDDVQVGDEVVGYGKLTYYSRGEVYEFDGNTESYVVSHNRPVVLKSITLDATAVKKTYKIGTDDVFSAEGLVVTAHYNVSSNDKTIDLANVTISGYDMTVPNTYTVTVSYTENEVTKSATYQIQVKPNCDNLATITMGTAENGTFDLSVKGEQCAETAISTVLTATPATHYHLASVTATNGTVGAIEGNTCTISGITADAEITAVFEEDAKGTATFVAGAAEATGTAPASITKYVGQTLTIPANTFVLAGHTFAGWKTNETTYQKNDEFTMVEGGAEFVAQWEALPVWASTYTSNVTVGTDAVKFSAEGTEYEAYRAGTSKVAGSTAVTVPAGATALHFHAAGWNGENVTLKVSNGATTLGTFALLADAGMTNNSPFTLKNDPEQTEYFMVALENITEETTITFEATAGKRFAIFGVNYVAPASVTLAPASYDFGEVKEGETAEFEFTATKNIFATGDITVTFEGDDAASFSAGAVDAEGKFTVTFAPAEVRAYSATVKVSVDGAEATATLSGEGISATTPTISADVETIEFGSVKQDATVADQTVNVTLEYLEAANVAITGTVFTLDKTALTENGAITISANTAAMGEYTETLTISGEGADSKTVTVTMTVISKYASEYTSNVTVGGDIVVIGGKNYEAIKKGTGSASQSTTITVPKGTQTLHFHAVAWNDENTVLVVKQGDNTLGSFNLYKDAGVKSNSPYTLAGNNYDTDQYFSVNVAAYTAEDEAVITFTTTASPYRFVLYGVNQEGGIVPVLDHIAIEGSAEKLTYLEGTAFNPAGLSVKAIYTFDGVEQEPVDVTDEVAWSFSPATLAETDTEVEATATYEGKTANKTISDLTVTSLADLKEENVDFAEAYANLSSNTALTGERGTLNAESYTITYAQNGATNAPTYYSTTEGDKVHTYVGNTITITAQKNIYMVEVSYVSGNTDEDMTTVANNDHGYIVCDGTTKELTMTATVKARITNITVFYEDQKEEVRGGLSVGKFGTICVEKMTLAPAGAHFYTLNKYDVANQVLTVTENTTGRLEAGVPYIFESEGAEINGIVVANAEEAQENVNGFYAVLGADKVVTAAEAEAGNIYGINRDEVRPAGEGSIFRSGRCYIDLTEVSQTGVGSAPARAFRVIGGTSVATGLEGLEAIEGATKLLHNGQIVILRDGKCYDTVGRIIK